MARAAGVSLKEIEKLKVEKKVTVVTLHITAKMVRRTNQKTLAGGGVC